LSMSGTAPSNSMEPSCNPASSPHPKIAIRNRARVVRLSHG
jgi:hypothetical protein